MFPDSAHLIVQRTNPSYSLKSIHPLIKALPTLRSGLFRSTRSPTANSASQRLRSYALCIGRAGGCIGAPLPTFRELVAAPVVALTSGRVYWSRSKRTASWIATWWSSSLKWSRNCRLRWNGKVLCRNFWPFPFTTVPFRSPHLRIPFTDPPPASQNGAVQAHQSVGHKLFLTSEHLR